jgi:hypothetical protein
MRALTAAFHAHAPVQRRVEKARLDFSRSLRRTPQPISASSCTGTRLPKAARHARRLPKASQGIGEAG